MAIVLSILLAFAIDAAWDESRLRVAEREALAGLREEFEELTADVTDGLERVGHIVRDLRAFAMRSLHNLFIDACHRKRRELVR